MGPVMTYIVSVMDRCPRCNAQATMEATPSGGVTCSQCSWSSVDGAPKPPAFIPTWKVVLPLVVPALLIWTAGVYNHVEPGRSAWGPVLAGLTFFLFGLWSLANGVLWERLSPGLRGCWRPPSVVTPFILAAAFITVGLVELTTGVRLLVAVP